MISASKTAFNSRLVIPPTIYAAIWSYIYVYIMTRLMHTHKTVSEKNRETQKAIVKQG
jgi:hypothetical protein